MAGNNANGVFPIKYYEGKFDAYQRTYVITPKNNGEISLRFLFYQLKTLLEQLKDYSIGSATKFLTLRILNAISVKPPPLAEQREIAHILGSLDDKIELNRRMNTTLEATARALFQSWFVDFDPVSAKSEGRDPLGMDAETAALFPDSFEESELGVIPRGWRVEYLGDQVSILETGDRPKGGVSEYSEGIPSIGAESIIGLGVFDYTKTKYVPEAYFFSLRKGVLENRDVLLYKDGGRPGIFIPHVSMFGEGFPFDTMCINSHVYRIRAKYLGQEFLYFWMSSDLILEQMHLMGGGAAIPGINSTQVKALPILIPPAPVVVAFSGYAKEVIGKVLRNCVQSRTLAETRDALLPKLISGEVRVSIQQSDY